MEKNKIKNKNFKEIIKIAEKSIKEGKVLICPTDTVYGLIADATKKKTVEQLFKIKKRSLKKPIPIFVKDIKMAKKLAFIDKNQEFFLKKAWPGKVTVILKPKIKFPKGIGIPKKEIGLRIPKYKPLNILLNKVNIPLAQTSVNISGKSPITNIKEMKKIFIQIKNKPDIIIDAGKLKNKSSIIIDLTEKPYKILRK